MDEQLEAARSAKRDGRVDEAIELYDRALIGGSYFDAEIVDEALPLVTGERLAARADLVRRWIDHGVRDCDLGEAMTLRFVEVRLALGDHDAAVALVDRQIDRFVYAPADLLDHPLLRPLAGHERFEALRARYRPDAVAERIERFAQRHLRGRALPADLRALLVDSWSGRSQLSPMTDLSFYGPDESSYLESTVREQAASGEPLSAIGVAEAELLRHLIFVGTWQDGAEFGYWLHPDEPETDLPPIVQCDSEGGWTILATGASLAEALAGDSYLFGLFAENGVPMLKRGVHGDRANRKLVAVHPEELFDRIYEAARDRS